MSNQSTTKTVELQTRQGRFNYHLSKLQEPYKKDIATLIRRCLSHGDSINDITELLSSNGLPITRQRVGQIARSK